MTLEYQLFLDFPYNFVLAELVIVCIPTTTLLSTRGQRHNFPQYKPMWMRLSLDGWIDCRLPFILIHDGISILARLLSPSTIVDLLIMLIIFILFDAYILCFIEINIYSTCKVLPNQTFFYPCCCRQGIPFPSLGG